MGINPPREFQGFCVGFDVALYRDTPRFSKNDSDAILDGAINYGIEGYEREDFATPKTLEG
jgi:hypothetical protein